jgi:hypothetical protein
MYWRVFFYIPGHQYILMSRSIVWLFLKCSVVGLLWFSRSTSSRRFFSTYTISFYRIKPFASLVFLSFSNLIALLSRGVFRIFVNKGLSAVIRLVTCIAIFSSLRFPLESLERSVAFSLSLFPIKSGRLLKASAIILSFSGQCLILKLY